MNDRHLRQSFVKHLNGSSTGHYCPLLGVSLVVTLLGTLAEHSDLNA